MAALRPVCSFRKQVPMHPPTASLPTQTTWAAADLPAPDLASYSETTLRFACAAWPMRAAEELRSALIFRALYKASLRVRATGEWPARVASGVHDELRHARLCADVGARLGMQPPKYDVAGVRAPLAAVPDPLLRTASLLLIEVAIGQT